MDKNGPGEEKPVENIPSAEHAAHIRRYRSLIFRSGLLVVVILFAMLSLVVSTSAYLPIDLTLTRDLQSVNSAFLRQFMTWVSWPGFAPQTIILTALLGAVIYRSGLHWEALVAIGDAGLVEAINAIVKIIVHRPRPAADLVYVVKELNSYSFPSGHVMFYTAFFGFLFFLAFTLLRPGWLRTIYLIVFGGLILLIGVSRVYLGQHWTSDVVGAYLLGSLVLVLTIEIYRRGRGRFFVRHLAAPEK